MICSSYISEDSSISATSIAASVRTLSAKLSRQKCRKPSEKGSHRILAVFGSGQQFHKARDLAAWLVLVPREYSTGRKQKFLDLNKRGNHYVRKLLLPSARSCFRHPDRTRDRLGSGHRMASKPGRSPTKLSSHLSLKWHSREAGYIMQLDSALRCREHLRGRGEVYILFLKGLSKPHCRASHMPGAISGSSSRPLTSSTVWL